MTSSQFLQAAAQVASIATALIATIAYGRYRYDQWQKRIRLENYLKEQRKKGVGGDRGARNVLQLMAALGMTEAALFDAAFRSCHIKVNQPASSVNTSSRLLLEYSDADP